ncbi:MAG: D-alanine--D-alanine ligase [Candidatus Pacebacteria bacterium]|nr:D-alanine--D-alanine ligase [Candidatus Paceibacterota bacterium]
MKNVAIIYGGPSSEHDISIQSGKNILKNIDKKKYNVFDIFISKDKKFFIKNDKKGIDEKSFINLLKKENINIVYPVLHGSYGEDGQIQKLLEKSKINFVGSSSKASALAIDKNKSNKVYLKNKILIPKSKIIFKNNFKHNLNYPIIVKPIDEGSSVGLFKIQDEKECLNKKGEIFKNHNKMLAQEFISGREFTCGVLEEKFKNNIKSFPLPATEIILTKSKIFDYKTKYTKGAVKEITPANIDESLMEKIQDMALKSHKALGCKSISRTDIILNKSDNKLYVLETNTLPGMTKASLIPQQASSINMDIKKLIDILLS